MRRLVHGSAVALALLLSTSRAPPAQAQGGPETPLARRISVRFDRTDLGAALARLRTIFGIPLAYSSDAIPSGHPITLEAEDRTVGQVLATLLENTGLRVVPTPGGTLVIVAGEEAAAPAAPVTVAPAIATGIQHLDQIVVMGTPVAGAPEREQPSAVSVVGADELPAYRYSRTADLVRIALPGIVLWDRGPSGPPAEIAAVRGASSFTARGIKTYVDGVELASPTLFTLIDPRSIERIEVIRGPQGAALYGSDAINGIVHVVTRKGRIGTASRVKGWAAASLGPFDREALPSTIVRQSHAGTLEWGGSWSSAQVSGSMDRVGSAQTAPFSRGWGVQGGGQLVLGSLLLSGSARAASYGFLEERAVTSPIAQITAVEPRPSDVDAMTLGLTAVHQTTARWTQTLVLGYDRAKGALGTSRPLFATLRQPLAATHEKAIRQSLRLHSSLDADVGRGATVNATLGFEHAQLERHRGSWDEVVPTQYVSLYADDVRNTGTFVQGKLRTGSLVVSAGLRTEWNSSFGPNYGAAIASSVGASWTRPIGSATMRLRAGWGRGIRPPEPGMSLGMASGYYRQEPNPNLAPEVQAGTELGIDLFAANGGFARLTLFDQRATDLIQSVVFPNVPGGQQSYQFQNVGAIRNRGVEFETGLRHGPFGADLLVYFTESTIEKISRAYSGYLRPGDVLPEIPGRVGSARVSWTGRILRIAVGTSFVGPWTGYDWATMARVASAQDTPRPSVKDYLIRYPAVVKPYITTSVDFGRRLGVFVAVDNLTNTDHFERHNGNPPAGRSALLGLEVRP